MKRAIAGAYFAALCLHCVLWLRMLVWPSAARGDLELLSLFVVAGSPLVLLAAVLGLVEPRKPVALITGLIVLGMFVELFRAAGTLHTAKHLEAAIAAASLLLGVLGIVVVVKAKGQRSTTPT